MKTPAVMSANQVRNERLTSSTDLASCHCESRASLDGGTVFPAAESRRGEWRQVGHTLHTPRVVHPHEILSWHYSITRKSAHESCDTQRNRKRDRIPPRTLSQSSVFIHGGTMYRFKIPGGSTGVEDPPSETPPYVYDGVDLYYVHSNI